MKKLIIMLLVLSSFLIGCGKEETIVENDNLDKVTNDVGDNNINSDYFIEIGAQEFKDKVNSDGKYIFFLGRDTCPACKQFKPTAIDYSKKEKTKIYYVNSTNFNADDWKIIDSIAKVEYIPTIIISHNSKILYNENGVKTYDMLKNIIEEYYN